MKDNNQENPIRLSKRLLRDLDNYCKFISEAIQFGNGKYSSKSAYDLHDMRTFYYLMRYASKEKHLKWALNFAYSLKRGDEFDIPGSVDDYLCRYANATKWP